MGSRFSRSWQMVRHSASILRQDRELLVFPLFSCIAAIVVLLSFVPLIDQDTTLSGEPGPFNILALGLLYLTEYFVMFFFNSALIGAALIRMDGGDPTVSDGLRIAWSKAGNILGYTLIAATVGVVLRAVGERLGLVGRMIIGLLGVTWTAASFLTVPILVSRNAGPVDAVKESASLLKRTWGENLISNAGIGLAFMALYWLAFIVLGLFFYLAFSTGNLPLLVLIAIVSIVGLITIGLLQTALQGIFSAVLYRFATEGRGTGNFSTESLQHAFAPKPN